LTPTALSIMKVFALVAASLAVGSDAAKDSTITKVVKVLQDMLAKSKKEGDDERDIFAKFKCFCDTNEAEKKDSIESLGKQINVLTSKIGELQGGTGGLSVECAQLKEDMAANRQALAEATTIRAKELKEFKAESIDMDEAIDQMNEAIDTLSEVGADQTLGAAADHEQFMAGKFLQSGNSANSRVRRALAAVSGFLDPAQSKSVQSFLQSRAPFTGTYSSQSGQIVGILKSMRDTFESNLATAIAVEKQQKEAFEKLEKTLEEAFKFMQISYDKKQETLGSNDDDLSAKKEQLDEAKKKKENDEDYLEKLLVMCEKKTKEYNERKMLRANEDAAVAEAIAILNSDSAFEAFGKTDATKTGATGFIQLRSRHVRVHAHQLTVSQKVKQVLMEANSPRVSKIASLVQAENVFDEVLNEIAKMLKVIVKEGKADKENLDWCNEERTENDDELSDRNDEIDTLNKEIDELDTSINDPETGLKKQIQNTEKSLVENIEAQKTETKERQEANLLYQEDIKNLVAAESILKKAIRVLSAYYDKLEKQMKAEAGFLQEDPAPPDTWKGGGASGGFKGQSGKGGDAITMLKFILDETVKEETEAHGDEESSQHDYEDSMQSLKDKEAADEKTLAGLQKTLAAKEEELVMKRKELKATIKEKEAIEAYLLKIKPGCDFITKNFEQREKNRATETTALKKATKLIKATPVYKNFKAEEKTEGFGDCKSCNKDEDHVKCKACMAKTSIPGYCAGHDGTKGC